MTGPALAIALAAVWAIGLMPLRRWAFRRLLAGRRADAWPAGLALGFYWCLVTLIPPVGGLAPWSTLWPTVYVAASTVLTISLLWLAVRLRAREVR